MIRILSLDDEPELLNLYSLIFERKGYDHTGSANSYEAWVLLHADRFDLFTQDFMRPDVDGQEFVRALEDDSSLPRLPLIIISANARAINEFRATSHAGPCDCLTKPFGPVELLASLDRVGLHPPSWESVREGRRELSTTEDCLAALRDPNPSMRCRSLAALRMNDKLRPQAAEFSGAVIAALEDADPDVRLSAAKTAGVLADRRAVQPLLRLLDDAHQDVANTVLRALGQLNDPRGRAALLAFLPQPDWRKRCLAALALKGDDDVAVGRALLPLLKDDIRHVRLATAIALQGRTQAEVVEALGAALSDPDPWLHGAIVAALGSTHHPRAVDKLCPLLTDPDTHLVHRVIWALQELGEPALPALRVVAAREMPLDEHQWSIAKSAEHAVQVIERNLQRQ